jgi:hypothetical protein
VEVLGLCFDVEPLPNKGLGPGQLLAHQAQPKTRSGVDTETSLRTVQLSTWNIVTFLLRFSSLIVSMLPHAAVRDD